MKQEVLFAKKLEEVRALAADQGGFVKQQQVLEIFEPLGLSDDQLQLVYDYLLKHKVGIDKPLDVDEFLTDEEKNYLQLYLEEIEAFPKYTSGEVEAYTISAMAGDAQAQGKLVEMNLSTVVDIAKLYAGQGVLLEDLIGEGNVALATSVTMLASMEDPKEVPALLGRMIMNAMEEFIEENTKNHEADRKIADKVNKVMEKAKELSEDLNKKVTVQELCEETGMSEKMVRDAIRVSGNAISYIEDESGQ